MLIRTLIIDDERIAREHLVKLLQDFDQIEIIGQCQNGEEAVASILRLDPDLIFLDIQLKDKTGFDVLSEIVAPRLPVVVFVTAYDEFALKAFDHFALDYLLKPYSDTRFYKACNRAIERISNDKRDKLLLNKINAFLLSKEKSMQDNPKTLSIKHGGDIIIQDISKIKYLCASGSYVEVYTAEKKYLIRETLKNLEKRLGNKSFQRIHRSTLVNQVFIGEIREIGTSKASVKMRDGMMFNISQSYKSDLLLKLGLK
jgi:two-component system LytT family response regulator